MTSRRDSTFEPQRVQPVLGGPFRPESRRIVLAAVAMVLVVVVCVVLAS